MRQDGVRIKEGRNRFRFVSMVREAKAVDSTGCYGGCYGGYYGGKLQRRIQTVAKEVTIQRKAKAKATEVSINFVSHQHSVFRGTWANNLIQGNHRPLIYLTGEGEGEGKEKEIEEEDEKKNKTKKENE